VQQAAPASGDKLGEQHEDLCVVGQRPQVVEERHADVPVRGLVDLERDSRTVTQPFGAQLVGAFRIDCEVDRSNIVEVERARVIDRAHRCRIHARDEHAGDDPLARGCGRAAAHHRHVGHDHAGLLEQTKLQRELVRVASLLHQLGALEVLGDDDGHEVGLATRQLPDLLQHRIGHTRGGIHSPERGAMPREPAGADAGIRVPCRHVDRPDVVRDLVGKAERRVGGVVERLDEEQCRVVRGRGGNHRGCAGPQPSRQPDVMAPDAVHHEHEQRDRDDDEPRAFGELGVRHDQRHEPRCRRADAVHERLHPVAAMPDPVAHHACLRERERREHADHVEVDEAVRVRAVDPEEQACDEREDDHSVREDEPVAEVRELARREAIAREQRCQTREALERRVRGENEHHQGEDLDGVVHERPVRSRLEHGTRDLRDHRIGRAWERMQVHGEIGDADEERDRDGAEHPERDGGVSAMGLSKCVDSVCDRLHARQGSRARGERAQEDEEGHRAAAGRKRIRGHRVVRVTRRDLDDASHDEEADRRDEEIGRKGKDKTRLAHAAKVRKHDQDEAADRKGHFVVGDRRHERRDREDAGGDRDRHRQHIIGQERRGGDEARRRSEILASDDIRTAARFIHTHRLHVRDDDDGEERRDRERDWEDEVRRCRGRGHEDDERGLGRVRHGRKGVGREDRKREPLREKGLLELVRLHRATDDEAPEAPLGCNSGHGSSAPKARRTAEPRNCSVSSV
jgi:hypothetical protein